MEEINRIAIIPARGGSKRLARKNVIMFRGRPMLCWTIEAALKANLFKRVIVSTEDKEISEIAIESGAEVDYRDAYLAEDSIKVVDVCLNFLDKEESCSRTYDIMCCLYATAPMRTEIDIRATVDLVESGQSDFAVAVTNFDLPPYQAMRILNGHKLSAMWPQSFNMRESEIGKLVVDNGSTYVARVLPFRQLGDFFGSSSITGHLMPRSRSVDIDSVEDLRMLELYSKISN